MSSACWIGALGAFWRFVCRRLRAINDREVDVGSAANPSLLVRRERAPVKPNVDYSRFDRLLKEEEDTEGLSVAVCGRKGSNQEAVNGVYLQDGTLNGCPRLKKNDGTRWLKFTDDKKWMISRYPDGRPLGEAYAEAPLESQLRSDPKAIPGPWFVYSKDKWEEDQLISVTPANCAGCGKLLQRLQRCSQCRAVSYCDHSCQKGDWQFHKRLCSKRSWKLPEGECYAVPENQDTESFRLTKKLETTAICAPNLQKDGLSFSRRSKMPKVSGQNWEERDLLGWSKQRLGILFEGPEERENFPALRVLCRDGGRVEVTSVTEIDGLASVWPNQGDRRHLFDLSFQLVFKAFWLSDFSLMSMDGTVTFHDFTTDLVDSAEFVCGMSVDFAQNSESPVEEPRTVMQTAMPPTSKAAIQEALGADAWTISRGEGLMHLVHLRLKHFAKEFEAQ